MKAFLGACLSLLVLAAAAQANDKICLKELTLNVQGQIVQVKIKSGKPVVATVDNVSTYANLQTGGYTDGLARIALDLTLEQKPNLTPEQKTGYDDQLDHHTILSLLLVLNPDNTSVQEVVYDRRQDIDYGYNYATDDLNFSVVNVKTCR